jgi:glycosyltransferase involved in cell wall biosynthesis
VEAPAAAIVVPCYNESRRLPVGEFESFLDTPEQNITIIFVDDGSRDTTRDVLKRIQVGRQDRVLVIGMAQNSGKGEAVRCGIANALGRGFPYVGFWDADLATPLGATTQLLGVLREHPEFDMVFGARVKLLGRHIERRASRHYLGRVFATAVSLVLQLPIYDSQCGAKLFRATPQMREVFGQPFLSRWIFDVEIVARYIAAMGSPAAASSRICEYPLDKWADIQGSKLKPFDFAIAACDLARIYWKYLAGPSPRNRKSD